MSIRGLITGQAALRIAVGISSRLGVVFPAPRMDLQMSVTVAGGNSILQMAVVGESKGMSPTSAVFVKRLQTRILHFLSISAASPINGFCRSVNRGLQ